MKIWEGCSFYQPPDSGSSCQRLGAKLLVLKKPIDKSLNTQILFIYLQRALVCSRQIELYRDFKQFALTWRLKMLHKVSIKIYQQRGIILFAFFMSNTSMESSKHIKHTCFILSKNLKIKLRLWRKADFVLFFALLPKMFDQSFSCIKAMKSY